MGAARRSSRSSRSTTCGPSPSATDRLARDRRFRPGIPQAGRPRQHLQRDRQRIGSLASTPPPRSRARSFPTSISQSAAPSPSPAACRIRWPSWSRSIRSPSASASISTMSISAGSAKRSKTSRKLRQPRRRGSQHRFVGAAALRRRNHRTHCAEHRRVSAMRTAASARACN